MVRRLGRQARTALCTTSPQNAATANSGHARPKAVATLANENTRLVGAFHNDAPSTQNWLSETGVGFRAGLAQCQCLIGVHDVSGEPDLAAARRMWHKAKTLPGKSEPAYTAAFI